MSSATTLLIVDDDIMSREILAVLLQGAGYTTHTVPSGEAALDHLGAPGEPPAVVLTDIQLPGIAGPELASALRSLCPAGTLLLAMSGSQPEPETIAPFDAFLLKPFPPETVSLTIENCRETRAPDRPSPKSRTASHESGRETHKRGTAHPRKPTSKAGMGIHTQQGRTDPFLPFTPPAPPDSALDQTIYSQLTASIPAKQLKQMYQLCLDDVRVRIDSMRGHADAGQAEPFAKQAHAIKGGCGMLGASELYRLAAILEKTGLRASGLDGTHGVNPLDELAAACDRLERILGTRT